VDGGETLWSNLFSIRKKEGRLVVSGAQKGMGKKQFFQNQFFGREEDTVRGGKERGAKPRSIGKMKQRGTESMTVGGGENSR